MLDMMVITTAVSTISKEAASSKYKKIRKNDHFFFMRIQR